MENFRLQSPVEFSKPELLSLHQDKATVLSIEINNRLPAVVKITHNKQAATEISRMQIVEETLCVSHRERRAARLSES